MMNIEFPSGGKLSPLGHSIRSALQNDSLPIIDILVREAIQNGLDAAREDCKYVNMDFITGNFNCLSLNKELPECEEKLNRSFLKKNNRFLAIRDGNTVGLTGRKKTDGFDIANDDNFFKLVYGFHNEQTQKEAGGAWGLGKTIFFKVGVGLVLYYSRVRNTQGSYESRFAVSFIEDERIPNSFVPHPSGIAWWGEETAPGSRETQPITDARYIKKILDIFGLEEYGNEETGTTIIIPYINEDALLNSARFALKSSSSTDFSAVPYWDGNVEESINIAIQRWYAPRLYNRNYPYGKYLEVRINGSKVKLEPVFWVIQRLYKAACQNNCGNKDCIEDDDLSSLIQISEITVNKVCDSKLIGSLAYVKVSDSFLKMTPPDNKYNPFEYLGLKKDDFETNPSIVCFTRKPGMIVSYSSDSEWNKGIPYTSAGDFLLAIFVLNSANKLKQDLLSCSQSVSLEEYVRNTERADHFSWEDNFKQEVLKKRIDVIDKIKTKVSSKLKEAYQEKNDTQGDPEQSGLSRFLSKFFLPPLGFGSGPSVPVQPPQPPRPPRPQKSHSVFKIESGSIQYDDDRLYLTVNLQEKFGQSGVEVFVDSTNGAISLDAWETEMGLDVPFSIVSTEIFSLNSKEKISIRLDDKIREINERGFNFCLKMTAKDTVSGISISSSDLTQAEFSVLLCLRIHSRNVQPTFKKWVD